MSFTRAAVVAPRIADCPACGHTMAGHDRYSGWCDRWDECFCRNPYARDTGVPAEHCYSEADVPSYEDGSQ